MALAHTLFADGDDQPSDPIPNEFLKKTLQYTTSQAIIPAFPKTGSTLRVLSDDVATKTEGKSKPEETKTTRVEPEPKKSHSPPKQPVEVTNPPEPQQEDFSSNMRNLLKMSRKNRELEAARTQVENKEEQKIAESELNKQANLKRHALPADDFEILEEILEEEDYDSRSRGTFGGSSTKKPGGSSALDSKSNKRW
eukprot:TRINITY_DN12800_c0_g1_i2.p2 TRINITY_DN12800_c0_g1~~TRINITY_DN12800_c0_g1_i2.p2  ORF type:complete len:196 (-),score=39.66 TRINITY_DN12800_c0_g1_i2:4-591(-)